MSTLDPNYLSHLSHLARLDLSEEEIIRYSGQLSSVVDYVEQLSQVSTSDTTELKGVTGQTNVLAEDMPRAKNDPGAVSPEAILTSAPAQEEGFLVVRAVLGDELVEA